MRGRLRQRDMPTTHRVPNHRPLLGDRQRKRSAGSTNPPMTVAIEHCRFAFGRDQIEMPLTPAPLGRHRAILDGHGQPRRECPPQQIAVRRRRWSTGSFEAVIPISWRVSRGVGTPLTAAFGQILESAHTSDLNAAGIRLEMQRRGSATPIDVLPPVSQRSTPAGHLADRSLRDTNRRNGLGAHRWGVDPEPDRETLAPH